MRLRAGWLCLAGMLVLFSVPQPYLLMQPIQDAIENGDFAALNDICTDKVSVNLESPFHLSGYFYREKFIARFAGEFSRFVARKIEWISLHIQDDFAIQSLNLILENRRSGRTVYYKFIFFMTQKQRQWKLYNLRGLRL